jgi:glycine betaine catabolism B
LEGSCYIVQEVIQELDDVRSYRFDWGLQPLDFKPGQFVACQMLGRASGLKAALTFSTAQRSGPEFQFTLKRTGDFGTEFYDFIQPGDVVSLSRPTGPWCLEPSERRAVILIGRDYTVVGARAFYQELKAKASGQRFSLWHEVSGFCNVLFLQELQKNDWFDRLIFRHYLNAQVEGDDIAGPITLEFLTSQVERLRESAVFVTGEGVDVKRYREMLKGLGINAIYEKWS